MTSTFRKTISTNIVSSGIPAVSLELERITVFLGANGSGKSKLLLHLLQGNHSGAFTGLLPVYVEGGRVFPILHGTIAHGAHNADVFSFPSQGLENHVRASANPMTQRINSVFYLLEALGENLEKVHSREVTEWIKRGRIGECPEIAQLPIDKLFELFASMFPSRRLIRMGSIMVENLDFGSSPYSIDQLSDGEKQVLCFLADLLCLERPRSFFVIDEPELFLHPALAERLWGLVEETYPDSYFIYTTHSFSFAARPQVGCRYVIGHGQISEEEFWSKEMEALLRPFWGAVPLVIKNKNTLLIEGASTSIDVSFYSWLLENTGIEIIPVGSCDNVLKACRGASLWSELSRSSRLAGVVDLDFATELNDGDNIYRLELHESESYLCHPDFISALTEGICTRESISSDKVLSIIIDEVSGQLMSVASKRINTILHLTARPSLTKEVISNLSDEDQLVSLFKEQAERALVSANAKWSSEFVKSTVKSEIESLRKSLAERDVENILKKFEGKRILPRLMRITGSSDQKGLIKAARKHLSLEDFPHLLNLQASLKSLFVK